MLARAEIFHIFAILIFCGLILLAYLSVKYAPNVYQKSVTLKVLLLGLVMILVNPYMLDWTNNFILTKQSREDQNFILQTDENINETLSQIKKMVESKKDDSFIKELISARRYPDLLSYSQNLMVMESSDYLVICDSNSQVLVRAHSPRTIGDDCTNIIPGWQDGDSAEVIYKEHDNYYLLAGAFIKDESDKNIAGLIQGRKLTSDTLLAGQKTRDFLLFDGKGFSANTDKFNNFDQNAVKDLVTVDNKEPKVVVGTNQSRFLLTGGQIGGSELIMVVKQELNNYRLLQTVLTLLMIIFALIIIILARIKYPHNLLDEESSIWQIIKRNKFISKYWSKFEIGFELGIISALIAVMTLVSIGIYYNSLGSNISEQPIETKPNIEPNLSLETISYTKKDVPFESSILINNSPTEAFTIRASINFENSKIQVLSLSTEGGICDTVYDKIIDNNSGNITFSCVTKFSNSQQSGSATIAKFTARPKVFGYQFIALDEAYSNISSADGATLKISHSSQDGECILVHE